MKHQTRLVYTEALLRRAVFAFWLRTVGIGFLVALALLACSLAFLLWRGDRSWFVGALGAFLVFGLGFAALLLFSKARFVTLPLADIPSDAQELIMNRVAAAGGKVVG